MSLYRGPRVASAAFLLKGDVAQLRMSMAVLLEAVRENTDKIGKLEANKLHMLAQSLQ